MIDPVEQLRIAHVWGNEVVDDRLFSGAEPVSIGSHPGCTFVVPCTALPRRFELFTPKDPAWIVRLTSHMRGRMSTMGETLDIGSSGEDHDAPFQQKPIGPGDWGVIDLADAQDHKIFFHFVTVDPLDPAPRWSDRRRWLPALIFAIFVHVVLVGTTYYLRDPGHSFLFPGSRALMTAYLARSPEPHLKRAAVASEPDLNTTEPADTDAPEKPAKHKKRPQRKHRSEIRSAKQPRNDPENSQGSREGVKAPDVGLTSAASRDVMSEMLEHGGVTQDLGRAMARLTRKRHQRSRTAASSRSARDVTAVRRDTAPRQRDRPHGETQTVGEIDTGETRRPTREAEPRRPRTEVALMTTGTVGGELRGLSREEIDTVIKSRAGLIRSCYQKQLNRIRGLGGELTVFFKIAADGSVSSAKVIRSANTLRNNAVEDCVTRQILRLRFPPKGGANVKYPFLFSSDR